MNDTTVPDQLSRDEVYTSVLHGLIANLPAPKSINFQRDGDSVSIEVDSIAELHLWRDWFGMQDREVRNQPHPSLSNPADMEIWLANTWTRWRGWHLTLAADDPITDEQRDGWVSSGKAAEFAEYEAKQAAEASGLTYSREPDEADDPTPVSPARGWHAGAMVAGGEMVDEARTLSAAIHFSNVQREAARHAGRISSERLRAITLDLLHDQARAEDAERTQRADVREGEQGRITNPELARFLAEQEEKRRVARHFLGLEESAKHHPIDETPDESIFCAHETGGGTILRRRCGRRIWKDGSRGWHHLLGDLGVGHVATPPALTPVSEPR
jgi:hypothetical protein